jgi:hypothetical protein
MLKHAKINLSPSTFSTLWKNKEAILSALENNLATNKKIRKCDLGNVDQALLEWFKVQRIAGFPINGPILKVQTETFAKKLGHENFTCNNGWLDRFKNRHNIVTFNCFKFYYVNTCMFYVHGYYE